MTQQMGIFNASCIEKQAVKARREKGAKEVAAKKIADEKVYKAAEARKLKQRLLARSHQPGGFVNRRAGEIATSQARKAQEEKRLKATKEKEEVDRRAREAAAVREREEVERRAREAAVAMAGPEMEAAKRLKRKKQQAAKVARRKKAAAEFSKINVQILEPFAPVLVVEGIQIPQRDRANSHGSVESGYSSLQQEYFPHNEQIKPLQSSPLTSSKTTIGFFPGAVMTANDNSTEVEVSIAQPLTSRFFPKASPNLINAASASIANGANVFSESFRSGGT